MPLTTTKRQILHAAGQALKQTTGMGAKIHPTGRNPRVDQSISTASSRSMLMPATRIVSMSKKWNCSKLSALTCSLRAQNC